MGAYQYQALKKSGSTCKGVIQADSERHARDLLRQQQLLPTKINVISKQSSVKQKDALSVEALSLVTRQLATLLAAGIPIDEALQSVAEQSEKASVREVLVGVRSNIVEGYSLAQAIATYPKSFPELYRATVSAGEQTGHLDLVLEKLAIYIEKQQKNKQKIQQALIYPGLMLLISIGIVSFLLIFVVPKIIDVFKDSEQALPLMTQILISASHFLKNYGLYLIITIVVLTLAFIRSLQYPGIKLRWHQLILKLPLVGYLSRSINLARYIHTFSILFEASVPVLETMRVSGSLVSNLVIKHAFDDALLRVREGQSISQSLKDTKLISPMACHLIASGEKSGQLSPMMIRAATYIDEEIGRLIDTALTLLEPLVILFMGAMVLFIVLATLLPIFSMQQLVGA